MIRYNERTTAERANARLKDEFGGRMVRVRGQVKVACHLMFGVLALAAQSASENGFVAAKVFRIQQN